MPKQKTNKAAQKRFKITGTGKVKRHRATKSHMLEKKSNAAKRHLRKSKLVSSGDMKRFKKLIILKK